MQKINVSVTCVLRMLVIRAADFIDMRPFANKFKLVYWPYHTHTSLYVYFTFDLIIIFINPVATMPISMRTRMRLFAQTKCDYRSLRFATVKSSQDCLACAFFSHTFVFSVLQLPFDWHFWDACTLVCAFDGIVKQFLEHIAGMEGNKSHTKFRSIEEQRNKWTTVQKLCYSKVLRRGWP